MSFARKLDARTLAAVNNFNNLGIFGISTVDFADLQICRVHIGDSKIPRLLKFLTASSVPLRRGTAAGAKRPAGRRSHTIVV
jgi:hypothetical protein